ncbi:MAG: DUF2341 domain-containing protein, partial [Verrucomicrobiota bacterium]
TNFPVLLKLTPSIPLFDYHHFAPNGVDLRFQNATLSSNLAYEIQHWNTNGDTFVWVRLPTLENGATHIWALWGDPGASATHGFTNRQVWSDFLGVWHLDGDARDAGPGAFHGDARATTDNPGKIVGAQGFPIGPSGPSISIPPAAFAGIGREVTLSVWQFGNPLQLPSDVTLFDGRANGDVQLRAFLPSADETISWDAFGNFDRIAKPAMAAEYEGQWNFWSFTANNDTGWMRIYLNGVEWHAGSGNTRLYQAITEFAIGSNSDQAGRHYLGDIDEFRVSAVERSSNWIRAAHATMNDPDVFSCYTVIPGRPLIETRPEPDNIMTNAVDLIGTLAST